MVSPTKDHNLCFGDADGEAIGCTERLHGVQQLLQPLHGCGEQRNVISIEQAGTSWECGCRDTQPLLPGNLTRAGCELSTQEPSESKEGIYAHSWQPIRLNV